MQELELIVHNPDIQLKKLSKTWSSPFLYNDQRVPPIHPNTDSYESKILYPEEAHFPPDVKLDVPVKLIILGSKQVGKSALALRYLTKNQCDLTKTTAQEGKLKNFQLFDPSLSILSGYFVSFRFFMSLTEAMFLKAIISENFWVTMPKYRVIPTFEWHFSRTLSSARKARKKICQVDFPSARSLLIRSFLRSDRKRLRNTRKRGEFSVASLKTANK